jgi:hypothetical protein
VVCKIIMRLFDPRTHAGSKESCPIGRASACSEKSHILADLKQFEVIRPGEGLLLRALKSTTLIYLKVVVPLEPHRRAIQCADGRELCTALVHADVLICLTQIGDSGTGVSKCVRTTHK